MLAAHLATTDDAHLFGDNEFTIRALAHRIAAKAIETHLVRKKRIRGCWCDLAHCGQTAAFHSHRPHTSFSLVGAIRYRRAYYLCRQCGKGAFPFDRDAGLTSRDLTPALERVATLAGTLADSFEKGAELLHEMAGVKLSESTIERTTEDAGARLPMRSRPASPSAPRRIGLGTRIMKARRVLTSNSTRPASGSKATGAAPPRGGWPTWA